MFHVSPAIPSQHNLQNIGEWKAMSRDYPILQVVLLITAIVYQNLNKSLLFGDTLFSTKCCQIAAIALLYSGI